MARLLTQRHAGLFFFIVGELPTTQKRYERRLRRLITQYQLNNVAFYGPTDDVASVLKATDIFVCSSVTESGPMSVWEAMAMEKAIVSTDVGAVSTYIRDGENGFVVAVKDVQGLSDRVSVLTEDKELRFRLGRRARITAEENLDVGLCAEKHWRFYHQVLAGEPVAGRVLGALWAPCRRKGILPAHAVGGTLATGLPCDVAVKEKRMGKLDGKSVIVTGASRGIGADIARMFAAEGGKVVCAARTLKEGDHPLEGSLESTVQSIHDAGHEATSMVANISLPEDCEKLVQQSREIYGPIDVLVNNAALTYYIPVREYPLNRWMRSWAINFQAPFILSKLVLEDMIPRRSGSIVNISSGASIGPGPGPYPNAAIRGGTCYGTQKAALERLTQGLAEEEYENGISVTCVSPSQVVPTAGTVFHKLVTGMDDPRGESRDYVPMAALLLATEPLDKVTGKVTYSQQVLQEFGWIKDGKGTGLDPDRPGSGYSDAAIRKIRAK